MLFDHADQGILFFFSDLNLGLFLLFSEVRWLEVSKGHFFFHFLEGLLFAAGWQWGTIKSFDSRVFKFARRCVTVWCTMLCNERDGARTRMPYTAWDAGTE